MVVGMPEAGLVEFRHDSFRIDGLGRLRIDSTQRKECEQEHAHNFPPFEFSGTQTRSPTMRRLIVAFHAPSAL
jgi:hypothetical protein